MPTEFHFVNSFQSGDELSLETKTQIRSCAALSGYKSMFETVPRGKTWRSRRGAGPNKSHSDQAAEGESESEAKTKSKPKSKPQLQYTKGKQCTKFTVADLTLQDDNPAPSLLHESRSDTNYLTQVPAAPNVGQLIERLEKLHNSLDEPALFYALTAFVAAHLAYKGSSSFEHADILWLKCKAITSINEALADPGRATSDSVIYAVFKMAAFERIYGDMDSHDAHIRGAQRMMALRGGMQNLEPVNSNAIRFEVYISRMLSGGPLYNDNEYTNEPGSTEMEAHIKEEVIHLPTPPDSPSVSVLPIGFSNLCLTSELLVILPHIQGAINHSQGYPPGRVSTNTIRGMRKELAIVEAHILVSLLTFNKHIVEKQHASSEVIVQCVRLATLSLAYHILSSYDMSTAGVSTQHERMAGAILKLCVDPYTIYEHTDGVIWVLFMIGIAVTGSTRTRLKIALARIHQHRPMSSWIQTRSLLTSFLYAPEVCDGPCMELWHQVVSISKENRDRKRPEELTDGNVWESWQPII